MSEVENHVKKKSTHALPLSLLPPQPQPQQPRFELSRPSLHHPFQEDDQLLEPNCKANKKRASRNCVIFSEISARLSAKNNPGGTSLLPILFFIQNPIDKSKRLALDKLLLPPPIVVVVAFYALCPFTASLAISYSRSFEPKP